MTVEQGILHRPRAVKLESLQDTLHRLQKNIEQVNKLTNYNEII